jgi:hypothetical protein
MFSARRDYLLALLAVISGVVFAFVWGPGESSLPMVGAAVGIILGIPHRRDRAARRAAKQPAVTPGGTHWPPSKDPAEY